MLALLWEFQGIAGDFPQPSVDVTPPSPSSLDRPESHFTHGTKKTKKTGNDKKTASGEEARTQRLVTKVCFQRSEQTVEKETACQDYVLVCFLNTCNYTVYSFTCFCQDRDGQQNQVQVQV